MSTTEPQVWISCLASYNAGRLVGEWADATDTDEMEAARDRVKAAALAASGGVIVSEEFAIHDYDGFPDVAVRMLGKFPDWDAVALIARELAPPDDDPFRAWLEFLDAYVSSDLPSAEQIMYWQESYVGSADSMEAYAEDYACECGWKGVSANDVCLLVRYLDWETIAEELFRHGTLCFVDGHVFDSELVD